MARLEPREQETTHLGRNSLLQRDKFSPRYSRLLPLELANLIDRHLALDEQLVGSLDSRQLGAKLRDLGRESIDASFGRIDGSVEHSGSCLLFGHLGDVLELLGVKGVLLLLRVGELSDELLIGRLGSRELGSKTLDGLGRKRLLELELLRPGLLFQLYRLELADLGSVASAVGFKAVGEGSLLAPSLAVIIASLDESARGE